MRIRMRAIAAIFPLCLFGCTVAPETAPSSTTSVLLSPVRSVSPDTPAPVSSSNAQVTPTPGSAPTSSLPTSTPPTDPDPPTEDIHPTCAEARCYLEPQPIGRIADQDAQEISGLAAADQQTLFAIDDATGTDKVLVLQSGDVIGRVRVANMSADNAEALASAPCQPGGTEMCLYIADIGDHRGRESVTIYRIAQPDPDNLPTDPVTAVVWTYTYSDGPTDAEAFLVADDGSLIVINKPQNGRHRIYQGQPGGGVLTFVRDFDLPPSPTPLQSLFTGNVVTDAAQAPGRVLLITYDQVLEYRAPSPAADLAGFSQWPYRNVPMPRQPQSEAVTYLPDGGYVVGSEGGRLDLVLLGPG